MHGIDIGPAYLTDQYCIIFIDFCSNKIRKQLTSDSFKAKSLSLLYDESTDSSVKENEATYAMYFNLKPEGSDSVEVFSQLLNMNYLKDQRASGLTTTLEKSLELTEIETKNKLIGYTSDCALATEATKTVETNLQADLCD